MSINLPSNHFTFSQQFAQKLLRSFGWQAVVLEPLPEKCIIIGAPHTSGWDFPLTLMLLGATRVKANWIAKAEAFRWPFGGVMRKLGGIPLNRETTKNFVTKVAEKFPSHETLRIAILPEGTRSKTRYWKSGFYYMALKAKVPVVMGFVDYAKKVVGLGPNFIPSGDIELDFDIIRKFYADKFGQNPEKTGEIRLRPKDEAPAQPEHEHATP